MSNGEKMGDLRNNVTRFPTDEVLKKNIGQAVNVAIGIIQEYEQRDGESNPVAVQLSERTRESIEVLDSLLSAQGVIVSGSGSGSASTEELDLVVKGALQTYQVLVDALEKATNRWRNDAKSGE